MRSPLVWESPIQPGVKILIETEPLKTMDLYRQDRADKPEAGGILMGFRRGCFLHVTKVTVPQVSDFRQRFRFNRSTKHHQKVALDQWRDSDMTMDYLGEWHTHPEIHPTPSSLDMSEWQIIFRRRSQPMLFMILGITGEMWIGLSHGKKINRCTPISVE